MHIGIGSRHGEYLSALATLALGVFSSSVAAGIRQGPLCVFLFLLAFALFVFGFVLVVRVFIGVTKDIDLAQRNAAARRARPAERPPQDTVVAKTNP